MEQTKRRRLNADGGRELIERFKRSGLSVSAFCEREAISPASLYRWRSIVDGAAARLPVPARRVTDVDEARAAAGFVELGALSAGGGRVELRLDLGAGVLLHLVRG